MLKYLASIIFIVVTVFIGTAQITEGSIVYQLNEVWSEDPNQQANLSMLKGSKMSVNFDENNALKEMNMMGGMMITKNYQNFSTNKMMTLIDAMGQKIWYEKDIPQFAKDSKENFGDAVIEYNMEDKKEILGYITYKAKISSTSNPDISFEGYISEDIKLKSAIFQGAENLKINGFPLEMTIILNNKMKMSFMAIEVNKKLDTSVFSLDTEGYTKMSEEEWNQMMGGASGMGF